MTITPRFRKFTLTTHVSVSVGWLGAVAAYLALAITGLGTQDSGLATAAYRAMEVIGWVIIAPCGLGALVSGLVEALGTKWGPFRHYWILAKLSPTTPATAVLFAAPPVGESYGSACRGHSFGDRRLRRASHAAHSPRGGRLAGPAISVYKPWGRIGTVGGSRARRAGAI